MKRNYILNLIFLAITVIFLILSILIEFFFFLPIICLFPFSFWTKNRTKYDSNLKKEDFIISRDNRFEISHCPSCGGELKVDNAKFCYHCGTILINIEKDEIDE